MRDRWGCCRWIGHRRRCRPVQEFVAPRSTATEHRCSCHDRTPTWAARPVLPVRTSERCFCQSYIPLLFFLCVQKLKKAADPFPDQRPPSASVSLSHLVNSYVNLIFSRTTSARTGTPSCIFNFSISPCPSCWQDLINRAHCSGIGRTTFPSCSYLP